MSSSRQLLARALNRLLGPLIPQRFGLPFHFRLARLAGCEPELRHVHRLGPNKGNAIDVGANEGLYSYRLAALYDQVHAFEILPNLANRLRLWRSKRLEVHSIGLSDRAGSGILYVPIRFGRPLYGWASFDPTNCPDAEKLEEHAVSFATLDSFGLEKVAFIKADVEGHEVSLLAGARATIERWRPVVLLEVKAANLPSVRNFFSELGYVESNLDRLIGVAGSTENYIFLPAASA